MAVGNAVVGLHRSQIGAMQLPQDLAPGQWRWITPDELQALSAKNNFT
jgi:16S rRNA pseudouridine516 synthase